MEPSNVRKDDKTTSDVNKGVTEAEYTGSNAGPTDGGTNGSRNAPRASAPGVGNASAEESGSAFEDDKRNTSKHKERAWESPLGFS